MSINDPVAASSAALESTNLWSSILDSVGRTRGSTTKNLIVLGNHESGKSTLVSRLSTATGEAPKNESDGPLPTLDLGLSYSCVDVGEEDAEEEGSGKLGIYQLPSASPPFPALLPLALTKSTLLDSLVVIVLDWEKPWLFLRELRGWIQMLEAVLSVAGDGWEGAEGRERIESHWRSYSEPVATVAGSLGATSSSSAAQLPDVDSPLPPGVLVHNLGIPLIIVCTKADQINTLEREQDYVEEQFDYIQQTLRTVALQYGAALVFTARSRPASFLRLRSYILHRLFSPPPTLSSASPLPSVQPSRAFRYPHRASVIEREQIMVPAGWDTWGKIRVLRESFDCAKAGKGWEDDLRSDEPGEESLVRRYEELILDLEQSRPINPTDHPVTAQNEMEFLHAHYQVLQADREKDPRNAFAASRSNTNAGLAFSDPQPGSGDRDSAEVMARLAKLVRKDSATALNPSTTVSSTAVPSSTSTEPPAPGGQAENALLANFFQSLLTARATSSTGTTKDKAGK